MGESVRTLVVMVIICVNAACQISLPAHPEVVQGTPVPITTVPTEDCPDVTHCDN